MKCPFCANIDTKVVDSRALDENTVIKRRRFCDKCGEKFTTYERLDTIQLTVIKQDGTREIFSRDKILNGLIRSCNKRNITRQQLEKTVDEIEAAISNTMRREVETKEIGELVMEKLKEMDEVAYVRFASVYKQFKNIDTFMEELAKIQSEKENSQNDGEEPCL